MNVLLSYSSLGSTPAAEDIEDFVLCAFVDELVKMKGFFFFGGGGASFSPSGRK